MHIHFQGFIPQQILAEHLIYRPGIIFGQIDHFQCQCLFIQFPQLWIRSIHNPFYFRGHHVIYRCPGSIFFQIDHRNVENRPGRRSQLSIECSFVFPPIVSYQIQTGHSQHDTILKPPHQHPHKTDRFKIGNSPVIRFMCRKRYFDLIPFDLLG